MRYMKHTTCREDLDDIDYAYHSKATHDDPKIREAARLLGEVMGYYYEDNLILYKGDYGQILGFCAYRMYHNYEPEGERLHILSIGSLVEEPGIGRVLIEEAVKTAKSKDAVAVTVKTIPKVRDFYKKMGFMEQGTEDMIMEIRR